MSTASLSARFPRLGLPKSKTKKKSRSAKYSTEYNMMLTATLCLLAFGAVMVFSASSTVQVLGADGSLSQSTFFLKRTLMFGAAGLLFMHLAARYGLDAVRRLTPAIVAGSFFLLFIVLIVGTNVNGATRWLGSGFIQVQPSEIAKLALILYGAHLLASHPKRTLTIPDFLPYLLVTGLACLLLMAEPDLGTTMVTVFAVGAMLIAAGARMRDLVLIAAVLGFLVLIAIMIEPYRRERLIGFLNPGADAGGSGFQAAQAKIALGSGGFGGVGIGDGVQKAYYLPEAHTDMIAAVIGEEVGFIGMLGIVGLFGMFGFAGFRIAQKAKDRYGKLLAAGLTSLILVQAVINLYAVMGLAPLTGVPLPFVSYGNSSLMVSLVCVGLLLNIAKGGTAAGTKPARRPGRLTVVDGGRGSAAERSKQRSAQRRHSAQGRNSRGGNRGTRRTGHGGRRRASG